MSKIVISVDMEYANDGKDSAILKKVVDSEGKDITETYGSFCVDNGYDTTKKTDIESAAMPFIKHFEAELP